MRVTPPSPATGAGACRSAVVPSPSRPPPFQPQQRTVVSAISAQVWYQPAATSVTRGQPSPVQPVDPVDPPAMSGVPPLPEPAAPPAPEPAAPPRPSTPPLGLPPSPAVPLGRKSCTQPACAASTTSGMITHLANEPDPRPCDALSTTVIPSFPRARSPELASL